MNINILVSTRETQGQRQNDFCWVTEGEILRLGSECDREEIDGSCGCRRSLTGVLCSKATTTFKVAEFSSEDAWRQAIEKSLHRDGWEISFNDSGNHELLKIAANYPVGTVLEKRGDEFFSRNFAI